MECLRILIEGRVNIAGTRFSLFDQELIHQREQTRIERRYRAGAADYACAPSMSTLYPVTGSASPATSGTPRPPPWVCAGGTFA